ncbi:hypothetical protein OPV22_022498 [Ensete ventricosum]|uniref:Uncharacterized protein n=1 Tax=Ensete ventricosum TaxID=4639 RepID=A0AAV8PE76_ENSVE|nr:hypothetical protein OPV22_022498 [Ensete ventricosum]
MPIMVFSRLNLAATVDLYRWQYSRTTFFFSSLEKSWEKSFPPCSSPASAAHNLALKAQVLAAVPPLVLNQEIIITKLCTQEKKGGVFFSLCPKICALCAKTCSSSGHMQRLYLLMFLIDAAYPK